MKQKRTTIRSFIKNFPVKSFQTEIEPFPNLKTTPYTELYSLCSTSRCYTVLSVKDESIYYAKKYIYIRRFGKNFYKENATGGYLYINPKEFNIKTLHESDIREFLKLAGIDWFKDIPASEITRYFTYPSILKSILIKSIYNEETFYKAIAKRVYRIDISWRLMREFCAYPFPNINLKDIFTFCMHPEQSLSTYMHGSGDFKRELEDLLRMAVQLNQTIDFTWSKNRIRQEHQKQIEAIQAKEVASKSTKQIYNAFRTPSNIKLLNTELDVFVEGQIMHHCLYHCYWERIKAHNFVAFHMTEPEDCTFSVILKEKVPVLEQCHLKYNYPISSKTKLLIESFINDHSNELKGLLDGKELEPFEFNPMGDLPY